ncbi:hypothetical protein BDV95DRAFT_158194 [Massariosphaeria phaeospora]|uniref:Uncharacterized protein n=1 Tax=Massariosphaeria phaeospora TaxID=100035 RepID=A0A7C8IA20_9PLEO|nr:hypothetical protein BDV95DRAFT_158194 [Massariosphaeria phaeospora]
MRAQLEKATDGVASSELPSTGSEPFSPRKNNARPSSLSGSDTSTSIRKRVTFQLDPEPPPESTVFPLPPPPPPDGAIPVFDPTNSSHPHPPPPPPPPPPPDTPQALDPFHPTLGLDGAPRLNKAAIRVYTKFMDELAEFVELQGSVISSRVEVQQERVKLRIYRERVSKCDMDFIDRLRGCMSEGTVAEDAHLQELYQASQTARDEVGPLEVDYEELEVKLGANEFALKEKYTDLEFRYQNFFKLHATSTTMVAPSSIEWEDPSQHSNANMREPDEQEPREYQLFHGANIGESIKVGQLPRTVNPPTVSTSEETPTPDKHKPKSKQRKLSVEMHELAPHQTTKLSDGEFMADSVDDFYGLGGSPSDWKSAEVRSQNLQWMGDLPPISEFPEELVEELAAAPGVDENNDLLLRGSDEATQSTLSDYLMNFDSTRDRVNRWLLHKLRVSPWEVFELRRHVAAAPGEVPDWAAKALQCWADDTIDLAILQPNKSLVDSPGVDESQARFVPAPYPSAGIVQKGRKGDRASFISNVGNSSDIGDVDGVALPPDSGVRRFDTRGDGAA